jgi:hypothetical protein
MLQEVIPPALHLCPLYLELALFKRGEKARKWRLRPALLSAPWDALPHTFDAIKYSRSHAWSLGGSPRIYAGEERFSAPEEA